MSDAKKKSKRPEVPSCASPPCSMHEFAAHFGLDDARDDDRGAQQAAPAAPTDEAPRRREREAGD